MKGMKGIYSSVFAVIGLVLIAVIVAPIGSKVSGLFGMFQPHTYNWGTGMPFLCDETNAYIFRQANQRWPTNYEELAIFMKQSTNYDGFDRFDFITKPDGNLEIIAYTFGSGMTNRIIVKAPDKP
jgi:hypothetical protein